MIERRFVLQNFAKHGLSPWMVVTKGLLEIQLNMKKIKKGIIN